MHTTLKFFIIGAIIGLVIGLAPFPSEVQYDGDPEKFLKQTFSGTIKIAQVVLVIITIIILPFVAIEPLKKRLSPKDFFPLALLMGSSFSLSIITLISVFATLI